MSYRIESIDLWIRETPPDRMSFVIGRPAAGAAQGTPTPRRPRGIVIVRAMVSDQSGRQSWGVSGDRPSFGWLDKRTRYTPEQSLSRLLGLVVSARDVYLRQVEFETPFAHVVRCEPEIRRIGRESDHVGLSVTYASALLERALVDAVCRLEGRTVFEAVRDQQLGLQPELVLPQLAGCAPRDWLPLSPRTLFSIRHTVGITDPLRRADLPESQRRNDGEPETLEEYIHRDGLRYFKVKVSGNPDADLARLARLWELLLEIADPVVTLDANESFPTLGDFELFVDRLEREQLGLFQHTEFIEQPLSRELTLDPATSGAVRRLAARKPLVIDEADGEWDACARALQIGYSGASHKNCKGFFKSLINRTLMHHEAQRTGRSLLQTGEDLGTMPLVAVQQDFAALGILDINHCERNGHHYGFGLSHLTPGEKAQARAHHPDLYVERGGETFLNIQNGQVTCKTLQVPGMGVAFEPDWTALIPLTKWTPQW
jgi:hypothetical protein